eukprot:TRINITY_DN2365_c0_g1_i3.p1 TRINITY_DN2365_c0_g1~~TRINITY_DN2365_c0_g1_i3.p1  ORF type:complete len:123 (-),score=10.25 TRINITY_DN2365_c0_g1_i3:537-905(-)
MDHEITRLKGHWRERVCAEEPVPVGVPGEYPDSHQHNKDSAHVDIFTSLSPLPTYLPSNLRSLPLSLLLRVVSWDDSTYFWGGVILEASKPWVIRSFELDCHSKDHRCHLQIEQRSKRLRRD